MDSNELYCIVALKMYFIRLSYLEGGEAKPNSQRQPKIVICHDQKQATCIILKQNEWNSVMLSQKYHSLLIKHNNNLL